jgi:hypothetical protein
VGSGFAGPQRNWLLKNGALGARGKPAGTPSFSGKAATACLADSIRISPRATRLVMVYRGSNPMPLLCR